MAAEHFVGRQRAINNLQAALTGKSTAGKLTIQSIEGPGGIGKTCLFEHVLSCTDISTQKYLSMRLNGNDEAVTGLASAVSHLINTKVGAKPRSHYFTHTDNALKLYSQIHTEVRDELQRKFPSDRELQQAILQSVSSTLEVGSKLSDILPFTKKYVDLSQIQDLRPQIEEVIPHLISLHSEARTMRDILGRQSRIKKNNMKDNACMYIAEAFFQDLSTMLYRYTAEDRAKLTHKKLKNVDRLLLILDDYEKLQPALEEFLVGYVLPALQTAPFPSLLIVLGRDQLQATHPAWDQHLAASLLKPLVLAPLSRAEMDALVTSYGVTRPEDKERAWRDTQGYPFYVQLWIEEAESGGSGALRLKRFYDRTTRWMTEQEKDWLEKALFLDDVNKRSLRRMLDDAEEADAAFEWFIRDGSVRDTEGETFRVREYLRSRLRDYLRKSDPERYEALEQKAYKAVSKGV